MFKRIDTTAGAIGQRRADISWLRIFAVLLLFPFHTARVFNLGEEFYVKNDQLSLALSYFVTYLGAWHMPLLFLLAGAASYFALARRSGGRYAGERVKRLLVPFLFGVLVLIPPQSYLGLLSHSGSAPGFFEWLPSFFQLNGADMNGYFLGGHTWGHLWFIAHLFVYALVLLPVMLFLRRGVGQHVIELLARAASMPGVILLFALAMVPAGFAPEIAGGNPVFFMALFLLGFVIVADDRFAATIDAHRFVALLCGPLAYGIVAYFEVTTWPAVPGWAVVPLEIYLGAFVPWCFMVALLGYGRRFLSSSNRIMTYADKASYPVYLLHQTVIVAVAFVVVQWEVGVAVKFGAILLISLPATVLVFELVVRRVGVTRFLFGMTSQRRAAFAAEVPVSGAKPVPVVQSLAAPSRDAAATRVVSSGMPA